VPGELTLNANKLPFGSAYLAGPSDSNEAVRSLGFVDAA
jgi:hypothetical protein